MTEIYSSKCLLLEGARELAGKKKLDADKVICSAINLCDGTNCIYLSSEKADEERLEELREELKNVT